MQEEVNVITRSLGKQEQKMDYPAMLQPCPVTGMHNYISLHWSCFLILGLHECVLRALKNTHLCFY